MKGHKKIICLWDAILGASAEPDAEEVCSTQGRVPVKSCGSPGVQ